VSVPGFWDLCNRRRPVWPIDAFDHVRPGIAAWIRVVCSDCIGNFQAKPKFAPDGLGEAA
jgi:hypothetical protein